MRYRIYILLRSGGLSSEKILVVLIISILVLSLISCNNNSSTKGNEQNKEHGTNIISSNQNNTDNNAELNKTKEAINDSTTSNTIKNDEIQMEGAINNDLKIHMSIQIKDGKVQGSYYYDKYKTDIQLKGDIEANRMITMKEYSNDGIVTGTFDGWYTPGIRIEGSWINEKTKATMPFRLKILIYTTNINISKGIKLKLSDVINCNQDLLDKLKNGKYIALGTDQLDKETLSIIKEYINENYTDDKLIKLLSKEQNNFYFTKDSLAISLEVPHAIGDHVKIEVKYKDILNNLKFDLVG